MPGRPGRRSSLIAEKATQPLALQAQEAIK